MLNRTLHELRASNALMASEEGGVLVTPAARPLRETLGHTPSEARGRPARRPPAAAAAHHDASSAKASLFARPTTFPPPQVAAGIVLGFGVALAMEGMSSPG